MNKNIIFEKFWDKDNYFIIIYWLRDYNLSINYYKYMNSLEISLIKINIIIGFPLKNV